MRSLSALRCAALLCVCAISTLSAQPELTRTNLIPTAATPAEIIVDSLRDEVHVLTLGQDIDFSGTFDPDEGDISAAWFLLKDGIVIDSLIFNTFFNSFPVRAGADLPNGRLYLPINGHVQSYSMNSLELLIDTVSAIPASSVTFDPVQGFLILSERAPDFSSPGRITVIEPVSGLVLAQVETGTNPQMAGAPYVNEETGVTRRVAINEGAGGAGNASLSIMGVGYDVFEDVNGTAIGGGARHAVSDDGRTFLLIPGAGEVRIIEDLTFQEIAPSPITLGPAAPAGYRSLAVHEGTLYVGTSADSILLHDVETGARTGAFHVGGSAEAIAAYGDHLFVALPYPEGTVGVDSLVVVLDRASGAPVDTLVVGPRPTGFHAVPGEDRLVIVGGGEDDPLWWRTIAPGSLTEIARGTVDAGFAGAPARTAFDPLRSQLAFLANGRLLVVDATTTGAEVDTVIDNEYGTLFGLASTVGTVEDAWLVTTFPGDLVPEATLMHTIAKDDGRLLGTFLTGFSIPMNPVPTASTIDGAIATYLIDDAVYGSAATQLRFLEYHPTLFEGEMGDNANHIISLPDDAFFLDRNDIAVVTMNGSHEILFIDGLTNSPEIATRVSTGTEGFDGPRATAYTTCDVGRSAIVVTTYSSEVLVLWDGITPSIVEMIDPLVVDRFNLGGKGEGIGVLGDSIHVARIYQEGTYTPDSLVAVFDLACPFNSVDDPLPPTSLAAYPNPTRDRLTVSFDSDHAADATLTLVDHLGRAVMVRDLGRVSAGPQTVPFDLGDLPSGAYIIDVRVGATRGAIPVEVVR